MADINEMIRDRAYQIWEAEGRPEGRDIEHWARAEAEIRAGQKAEVTAEAAPAPAKKTARKPAARKAAAPKAVAAEAEVVKEKARKTSTRKSEAKDAEKAEPKKAAPRRTGGRAARTEEKKAAV
ncbi:DUF2934 domain-containing protein [Telmatospirillum sp. J64-1]|uniref:DUF2934 domain-containing protein n=1 Tax=Telmatospirillum sp. J64-1 TaxID=2502183 RepID=UPI00115EBCDB|nr:DUF2934 domain-containing protein [Telmatospirillum sp. J64-1]